MTDGLYRVLFPDGSRRWALGSVEEGPNGVLPPEVTLDRLLASPGSRFWETVGSGSGTPIEAPVKILAPIENQEVWAAGVTYAPSRDARKDESPVHGAVYDAVFRAQRPELFFKSSGPRTRGPGDEIAIRSDSTWNVPEPELVVVVTTTREIVALTIGNDASSRSIEGANPLYLPQAKIYDGSCALGPCLVRPPDVIRLDITLEIERMGSTIFSSTTNTSAITRSFADLVEWMGRALSFPVGAYLFTGTGIIPPPQFSLVDGDRVRISVSGLGELVNTVSELECGRPPADEATPHNS